jgi:hypothetical protein
VQIGAGNAEKQGFYDATQSFFHASKGDECTATEPPASVTEQDCGNRRAFDLAQYTFMLLMLHSRGS